MCYEMKYVFISVNHPIFLNNDHKQKTCSNYRQFLPLLVNNVSTLYLRHHVKLKKKLLKMI